MTWRLLLCLLPALQWLGAQSLAITGALVVDGKGNPPAAATVVVEGERITAVGPDAAIPPGAQVIDARGHTLLAGLFDLHTHLLATAGVKDLDWGKALKLYLAHGVTTVADLSTYSEQFEPMRRLIAAALPAPRVLMAARFSTPGGHGAEGGRGDFHTQLVQTPRQARAAVRRIVGDRPDLIKVFTDGWRYGTDADMTSMEEATLRALADEAHRHGIKVVTHTVTVKKAREAARAGVDIISHGIGDAPLDSETLGLMKSLKTGYVQTLAVYEVRHGAAPQARLRRWANLRADCALAREAGILMGVGTDAGMTGAPHGQSTLHELELLAGCGLTPLEALTAATGASARLAGLDDRGVIEPGKLADLVLVEGNPASKIDDIRKVRRVWLGGREVDRAALLEAVQRPGPTPLPLAPQKAPELIDGFEDPAGRTRLGAVWRNRTDAGHDHALMSYQRTLRAPGNHVLTVLAEMSEKEGPFAAMVLPLTRGGVLPADVSDYSGVEFEARGHGSYHLGLVWAGGAARVPFEAAPQWKTVRAPFAAPAGVRPHALLEIDFVMARPAGEKVFLEIDNVRLYR